MWMQGVMDAKTRMYHTDIADPVNCALFSENVSKK
jgi:hypothetical protein